VRLSGNTKPWLTPAGESAQQDGALPLQRPLPVSDRSTASAATTSRALLANTASCSSTITNRYSTASAQKLGQDNITIPATQHLGSHTNDPVPNKSALLIGIAAEWFQL